MDRETLDYLAELEQSAENVPSNDSLVPPGERECPICKKRMHVEVQCGVSIDVCNEHGIWLDRGELPAMIARVRSGERLDRFQEMRRARREGKMSGALFGVWALLFD